MEQKKEQKIIVLLSFTASDKNIILNGIRLASIFGKELCLTHIANRRNIKFKNEYEQKLNDYLKPVNREKPGLKTSALVINKHFRDMPQILADKHEAIIIVVNSKKYKKILKSVPESPVPFLFVNPDTEVSEFKKIVMPVDLRKTTSDSSLWSAWFGKFAKSEITVIASADKNRDSRQQINRNVHFSKKLYEEFGVKHKIIKGTRTSLQISYEALDYAHLQNAELFILLGSSYITPLDRLIGLPERKIIQKANNMSVLLINPRRDNYALCV